MVRPASGSETVITPSSTLGQMTLASEYRDSYSARMPGLDEYLSRGDPGDETGRRYQYQYIYTAMLSCDLLSQDDWEELFCEHHEDVLLKLVSGQFTGIQVKTRQQGLDPWKATDDEMVSAVGKFVRLDHEHPGQLESFTLATNHHFFSAKLNGANLPYVLELAHKEGRDAGEEKTLSKFIKKVSSKSGRSESDVLGTLRKTKCTHDLPKLTNSLGHLCERIQTNHAPAREVAYSVLRKAAAALTSEAEKAATLHHEQDTSWYLSIRKDGVEEQVKARINGKRMTRERVQRVLAEAIKSPPELLTSADVTTPLPLPAVNSKLAQKLTAGGLSAMTVNAARDCWSSALKQQIEWSSTVGDEAALARHRHLKALVYNEASAAHEATKIAAPPGPAMLEDLRRRLRERRASTPGDVFSSLEEQLLGRVYMLTEECKVWWSPEFKLTETV